MRCEEKAISKYNSLEERLNNIEKIKKRKTGLAFTLEDVIGFSNKDYHLLYKALYGKDKFETLVEDERYGAIFNKSLNMLIESNMKRYTKKKMIKYLTNNLVLLFSGLMVFFSNEIWKYMGSGNPHLVCDRTSKRELGLFIQKSLFLPELYPLTQLEINSIVNRIIEKIQEHDLIVSGEETLDSDTSSSIQMYFLDSSLIRDDLLNLPTKLIYQSYEHYCEDNGFNADTINAFNDYIRSEYKLKISRKRKNSVLKKLNMDKFDSDLDYEDRLYIWIE